MHYSLLLLFAAVALTLFARAQDHALRSDSTDISQFLLDHVDEFAARDAGLESSPFVRFVERRAELRNFQRRAYGSLLGDLLRRDGLMVLVTYLRTALQQEYSIDHSPIVTTASDGSSFVLPLDYTFPPNPWLR